MVFAVTLGWPVNQIPVQQIPVWQSTFQQGKARPKTDCLLDTNKIPDQNQSTWASPYLDLPCFRLNKPLGPCCQITAENSPIRN